MPHSTLSTNAVRSRAAHGVVMFFFGAVVACGGAAAESKSPRAAPEPSSTEPTSIEEAEAQIAEAERALSPRGESAASKGEAPASEPAPGARDKTERKSVPLADGAAASCDGTCRALASMRRAVAALCRIAGDEDARCVAAKKRLGENEARTAACTC